MQSVFRNFIFSLKRFKLSGALNILGLSAALAAFTVIMMQVRYELSFDRFHPQADRIFRLEGTSFGPTSQRMSAIHSRPCIDEFIASSPHIVAGTAVESAGFYYTVGPQADQQDGFQDVFTTCLPDIVHIFDFRMVEGDTSALRDPEKILIPESRARALFGDRPALGEHIRCQERIWRSATQDFTVGGVYRDFPSNSQIGNSFYCRMSDLEKNWDGRNLQCYLLLDSPDNAAAVVENFEKHHYREGRNFSQEYRLTSLPDAYYVLVDHTNAPNGNKALSWLLVSIALLTVVIAAINFTNFATALAPRRIRSINTQKILGNPTARIRMQLILEAVGISLAAYLVSLLWVWILSRSGFTRLVTADFALHLNWGVYLLSLGTALLLGLIAGLYPACYITSFQPALVIKGSFGLSPRGRRLRTGLIGLQYVISAGLIIMALFIRLQTHYATSFALGFDRDNIAVVKLSRPMAETRSQLFRAQVRAHASIEDAAFASAKLCGGDSYSTNGFKIGEQQFSFHMINVSDNFLRLMNIPLTEGRDFSPSDPGREGVVSVIFNEYARQNYNLPVGLSLYPGSGTTAEIVGFMDDIHIVSVRQPQGALAFVISGPGGGLEVVQQYAYVRIRAGANPHEAIAHIRHTLHEMDPTYPTQIELIDQVVENLYQKETRLSGLITWFCLLAVLISLMGVFGLVFFETQYRRKEIGLRKVFGATVGEILAMFNRSYVRIALACFAIAIPPAWLCVNAWLQNFVHRTPFHWWVFALALAAILGITILTVTIQSYRAATENPAHSIKTE